ncbi:hypothetical protein Tco_0204361 [Tanacetum coccineum]
MSSAKYGNKFLNDNADVSLNDVLKELVEAEVQSMVEVLVLQENPVVQRLPLVNITVTLLPEATTHAPKQQPPKRSKTKVILKKSKKPEEKVDADAVLQRLIKVEKKVTTMSKINHTEAIEESVQAKDPPVDVDKDSKKRKRKDADTPSSKKDDVEDDDAMVQDDDMSVDDMPHDDATHTQGNPQWFKQDVVMVNAEKDPITFDDLIGSTVNFTKFAKQCLKKDKITKASLEGPSFKLLKGNYRNYIELEYNIKKCYLALTYQIDWVNPKGDRCPYDLSKPLLLQGPPGQTTIPVDFFFNKDLEYLKIGNTKKKYVSSLTKQKAARYELQGLEEMMLKL